MNIPDIKIMPDNNSSNCFETVASVDLCTCMEKYMATAVTKRKKILKKKWQVGSHQIWWWISCVRHGDSGLENERWEENFGSYSNRNFFSTTHDHYYLKPDLIVGSAKPTRSSRPRRFAAQGKFLFTIHSYFQINCNIRV